VHIPGATVFRMDAASAMTVAAEARRPSVWSWRLATLLAGAVSGWAAHSIGLPIPWMLGPLALTAAASMAGVPAQPIPKGRDLGQALIGAAMGIQFTPAVLAGFLAILPLMVSMAALSIAVAMIGALFLGWVGAVDAKTAYFATVPGGVAEMASLGEHYGASQEAIAIGQAVRVSLVVTVAPLLVSQFAESPVSDAAPDAMAAFALAALVILLTTAIAAGVGLRRLGVPNAYMLGALFAGGALGVTGLLSVKVPWLMLNAAQVAIGIALGCQFKRDFVVRLPRVLFASALTVALMTMTMAALAAFVGWVLGHSIPTLILATAPAGIAEMVIAGKVMGLDATEITGFQVVRIVLVMTCCTFTFSLFRRLCGERR